MENTYKPFFRLGNYYLFIPRHDYVSKGRLVNMTDQELVFTDIVILKETKDIKSRNVTDKILKKILAIRKYIDSDDKESLEEKTLLTGVPVSYSRSEMAAIELVGYGESE